MCLVAVATIQAPVNNVLFGSDADPALVGQEQTFAQCSIAAPAFDRGHAFEPHCSVRGEHADAP